MATVIKQVEMTKASDHKRSVKYETSDPNAIVSNVYLSRNFAAEMPTKIFVAVSEDPIAESKKPKQATAG